MDFKGNDFMLLSLQLLRARQLWTSFGSGTLRVVGCFCSCRTLKGLHSVVAVLLLFFFVGSVIGAAQQTQSEDLTSIVKINDLVMKAVQLGDQEKYADAIPLLQEALGKAENIDEHTVGGMKQLLIGTVQVTLAGLYEKMGRYVDAESAYKKGLESYKTFSPGDQLFAQTINNFALLYDDEGRYDEAERLYKQALALRQRPLGEEDLAQAESFSNLASLYRVTGRYGEAEPLYQHSLEIEQRLLTPEDPEVARALNDLGVLYYDERRYAEAESFYKQALAIRHKIKPGGDDEGVSLNNLAEVYNAQGRYDEAEPLYKRSLAIKRLTLPPQHPDVALALNNLAQLYRRQGRYADAEALYKESLAIYQNALPPGHPDLQVVLGNLGLLYYARSLPQQAAPFYDRALANLIEQFEYYFTYMSEKERLAYLSRVTYRFPEYFSFCFTSRDQLPKIVGEMYDVVLWEKGFIAQSAFKLRALVRSSGDPEGLREVDELISKRSELASLSGTDSKSLATRRDQIEQLQKESNELERDLARRSSAFAEEKRLEKSSWQQVRGTLKADEAAVEFVDFPFHDGRHWTGKNYYVALVVRPESAMPVLVALGEGKELEEGGEVLQDYRAWVAKPTAAVPQPPSAGRKFVQRYWQPLEAALSGARVIYVSPDGALNQLSLGVMQDPDGKLLMEKYDLRIVSSTRDLLRAEHPEDVKTAVVIGNPTFQLTAEEQRQAVSSVEKRDKDNERSKAQGLEMVAGSVVGPFGDPPRGDVQEVLRSARCPDLPPGAKLCPLAGTQREVEAVVSALQEHGWQVKGPYVRQEALEEVAKRVQHPRVLHIATHAFFRRAGPNGNPDARLTVQQDPMLRSGLYFAGAERALRGEPGESDLDDGVLTAYEASMMDLRGTEMVVLSACGTGLGEAQVGEGVFGLTRGLEEAGAESVLISMWSVPDLETQELMKMFYERWLSGDEKATALRTAQEAMRERVKARYGRDLPYYWGAFVLVGR
jgi:CHAT domain-containing protein/tetratricopeptide (TPR) repeat protein